MDDGMIYDGSWKKGVMHGLGVMKDNKGNPVKYGVWDNGKLKTPLKKKKFEEMKK
jgi:hypothetical protein